MVACSLLPVVSLLLTCVPCAVGQLPKRLERCLLYPTLAQEIREMQPAPRLVRVRVIRVHFDPNDGIPADAQDEISADLRSHPFKLDVDTSYLNDLANEIAEVTVRGSLQNRGYFKVTATAKLTTLQTEGADFRVVAAIRATRGPQYRTGNIRFESADSSHPLMLSAEVLRGLIPLQRGELFSIQRLRVVLQNFVLA